MPTDAVDEQRYKADLELLDRYQHFSAELLRLSLIGIAVMGFFLEKIANAPYFPPGAKQALMAITVLTALSCLVSAAGALGHRYYSTDGIFYHLRSIRSLPHKSSDRVTEDENSRNLLYSRSGRWLATSAAAMCLAAFFAAVTIAVAVWSYVP